MIATCALCHNPISHPADVNYVYDPNRGIQRPVHAACKLAYESDDVQQERADPPFVDDVPTITATDPDLLLLRSKDNETVQPPPAPLSGDGFDTANVPRRRAAAISPCPRTFTANGKSRTVPCGRWTCADCAGERIRRLVADAAAMLTGHAALHVVLRAPDLKQAWNRFRTRHPMLKFVAFIERDPDVHLHCVASGLPSATDVEKEWTACGGTYCHADEATNLRQRLTYLIAKRTRGGRISHSHGMIQPDVPGQLQDTVADLVAAADASVRRDGAESVHGDAPTATRTDERAVPLPLLPPEFHDALRDLLRRFQIDAPIKLSLVIELTSDPNQTELAVCPKPTAVPESATES